MKDIEMIKAVQDMTAEVREMRRMLLRLEQEVTAHAAKRRFLTMEDACMYLGISRMTMHRRMERGEITFGVKKGGRYLFAEDKLRAYASGCD